MKSSILPLHLLWVLLSCGSVLVSSGAESESDGVQTSVEYISEALEKAPLQHNENSTERGPKNYHFEVQDNVPPDRVDKQTDKTGQSEKDLITPLSDRDEEREDLSILDNSSLQGKSASDSSSETPDGKHSTITTTLKPKYQSKKQKGETSENRSLDSDPPSHEAQDENYIKKIVQPQLKNSISKGRNLSDLPTTTGGNGVGKHKRRKRPDSHSTEMGLPGTSVAWALASLKTTPRGVPQVGEVKPFINWSTILTKPPTTQISPTVYKALDLEEFTVTPDPKESVSVTPTLQSSNYSTKKENIVSHSEKDTASSSDPNSASYSQQNITSNFEQNTASNSEQNLASNSEQDIPDHSKQDIPVHSKQDIPAHSEQDIASHSEQNTAGDNENSLNLIKPLPEEVSSQNQNDTAKNIIEEDLKEPDLSSSKESVITFNETEVNNENSKSVESENVINKSDVVAPIVTSPSSILTPIVPQEDLSEPQSISNSVNELPDTISDVLTDTLESNSDTKSNETPSISESMSSSSTTLEKELENTSASSSNLTTVTSNESHDISPSDVSEELIAHNESIPLKVKTTNLVNVTTLPPDESKISVPNIETTFNLESDATTLQPDSELSSIKFDHSSTSIGSESLNLNSASSSSIEVKENETFIKDATIVTTSTVQPKELNEVLPLSEIFKSVSTEKVAPESSLTVKPPEDSSSKQEVTTSKTDELNTIEQSDVSEKDPFLRANISEVASTIGVLNVTEVTQNPTSPSTTTTKFSGTLYTVNKTVHMTTKNPSKAEEFEIEDILNLNDTSIIPKDSEEVDLIESIDDKIFNSNNNNTHNFSKVSEEDKVITSSTTTIPQIPTTKPVILETTIKEDLDNSHEETNPGYDEGMYGGVTPVFTQLMIQANDKQLCESKEDLRSSILKLFKSDKRNLDRTQVVLHNLGFKDCFSHTVSSRSDGLVPIQVYLTNSQGQFDNSLTNSFVNLLSKDTLDFPYPVKSVEKIIGWRKPTETNYGNDGNNSVAAAIVISSIAGVCLLFITILLVIIRKRQKGFNYGQRCTPVSLEDYSLDNISVYNSVRRKGNRASKRSYGNPAFEDPGAISHVLNFATLSNFCGNRNQITEEFSQIPVVSIKPDELPSGVERKNRFANVIPLPETRVPIRSNKPLDDKDNYINANFVKGSKGEEKFYIACQAPLAETVSDFWQMIWEHQCRLIVMITELQEGGVEKSADYLPPSEVLDCHRVFGDLQVTLKKREVREKYVISSLQLKNLETNLWREVVHFWYLGWPHQGVPSQEPSAIIALLIEARSYVKSKENNSPMVVHCSPGTGRTGTIIAIDMAIRDFESKRTIDIPRTVYNIRKDRAGAVQTKDQYAFIYQVLHLYAATLTGGGLDSI